MQRFSRLRTFEGVEPGKIQTVLSPQTGATFEERDNADLCTFTVPVLCFSAEGLSVTIKAYLGLGSRYSYLASTQLDRIASETGADFDWIPVNSIDLIKRARPDGSPFDQSVLAGQYAPKFREQDAKRWAAHYKVAYVEPRISLIPSNALALACWCQPNPEERRALIEAIYKAVFVDGIEMSISALEAISGDFGVTADAIADALKGGEASVLHENATKSALKEGAFGVPTFVCLGELFWGNDRLLLLENHIRTASDKA